MLNFLLLFSRQGKLRLQKWYYIQPAKIEKKVTRDLIQLILSRKPKMCSFIDYKDYKIVYKRYASLYFCCAVDPSDNELLTLELIHRYVELLDKYFGSVCELDIIFNFEKAYFILDELLIGGEIQETNKKSILKAIAAQDILQDVSSLFQIASRTSLILYIQMIIEYIKLIMNFFMLFRRKKHRSVCSTIRVWVS